MNWNLVWITIFLIGFVSDIFLQRWYRKLQKIETDKIEKLTEENKVIAHTIDVYLNDLKVRMKQWQDWVDRNLPDTDPPKSPPKGGLN